MLAIMKWMLKKGMEKISCWIAGRQTENENVNNVVGCDDVVASDGVGNDDNCSLSVLQFSLSLSLSTLTRTCI